MILVSDYEGTLNQENISNEDVQAINTFRTQRHLFGLATGRPLNMMREELAQYNLKTDFIIGTNGGIVQLEDVFVISQIDHETLRGLITFISRYEDVMIHISNGYEYSTPIIIQNLKIDEKIPGKPEGIVNSILIRGSSDNENRKIYQELLFQGFQDLDFFYNSFNGGIIECVSKDVSKSSTIHKVFIDRLGYQKEDIFTIGNSLNDMAMIRDFNGFAVTDSDPQLIPLASAVFPNVSACIEYLMKL